METMEWLAARLNISLPNQDARDIADRKRFTTLEDPQPLRRRILPPSTAHGPRRDFCKAVSQKPRRSLENRAILPTWVCEIRTTGTCNSCDR